MRMSDAEAIMWAVEKDPALRSDFCNLTLLEQRPDDKRLRLVFERALAAIPRLGQRVVSPPLRIAPPEFADDPGLDLDYHVRNVAVPPPGDGRALLDVCAQIAEAPFDRSRPLWEFTVIDGLADGRAALLQKLHHTISDGVGALKLSLALLDFEPEPEPIATPPTDAQPAGLRRDTPIDVLWAALGDAARRPVDALRMAASGVADVVTHPHEIPDRAAAAVRLAGSLRRQALVSDPAHSDLLSGRSLRRHFEVRTLPLLAMKRAGQSLGGSVNDVFVTGLASALGRYHDRYGSTIGELRMAMPINTRTRGDEGANRFAPARVLVPIQPAADTHALFDAARARLQVTRSEAALQVIEGVAGIASVLPTAVLVAFTRNQARTIDFAATNLRGTPVPLFLGGARIAANYPFGPRAGTALNATMLGYCDELHVGFNFDPAAIVDIDGFLRDFDDAFAALLA
ncbi:MAG: wax ester/triacylglycerol synthase domain-containing protein [Actinomycetota bacterium]